MASRARFKDWSAFPWTDYLNKCEHYCKQRYGMTLEDSIEFHVEDGVADEIADVYEKFWLRDYHPNHAVDCVQSERIDLIP